MPISRKQLLYAMLAALGLAAVSGVLALFMGDADVVWRVAGTCFTAAIAAALMMPMAAWSDKPLTRTAGLTGMCISVALLLLAAVLIWGSFFSSTTREFIGMCIGILAGCGLVAVRFLKELHSPGWKLSAKLGTVGIAASGMIFLASAIAGSYFPGKSWEQLLATGMALAWSVIAGALCLVGWERKDRHAWRWAGIAGAVAATLMVCYSEWIKKGDEPAWLVGAYALAFCVAHALLSLRVTLTIGQRWVRWVAIAGSAGTGVITTINAAIDPRSDYLDEFSWIWRLNAAAALVAISASLALVVLVRLNRKPVVQLTKSVFDHVALTCPRCEKHLDLPVGGALCDRCKLHINITVSGAHCAQCGYDLADLQLDKCPECGTPVPTDTRGLTEEVPN